MPIRAAFYIDGFNLYHAVDDLNQPHFKWLNLVALANQIIPPQTHELVRVVHCTAVRTGSTQRDTERMLRHRAYLKALKLVGVECLLGHFVTEDRDCRSCNNRWSAPIEKQGDVNVAISLIDEAHVDLFDHAYLLTSDTDQKATINRFLKRFPTKKLTIVTPPGREHPKMFKEMGVPKINISLQHVERSLFPRAVIASGEAQIRPKEYDPPKGWSIRPPDTKTIEQIAADAAAARAAAEQAKEALQTVIDQKQTPTSAKE